MSSSIATLLIGEAALTLGLAEHQLRKACDEGVIDVPRAGRIRLFPTNQLDDYRERLRTAGLLFTHPFPDAASAQ